MSITIHVANLPVDAAEDTLRSLFSGYGPVQSLRIVRSGLALRATSYCLVEMPEGSGVAKAVRALNGQYFRGSLLAVESVNGRENPQPHSLRS